MCVLCQAQQNGGFPQFAASTGSGHIQYGAGSVGSASASNITNTDALISGFKWAGTSLTFALPTVATALPGYMPGFDETGSFAAVTGQLATGVRMAMAHIDAYTGLSITETTNTTTANMLVGRTGQTNTAAAYLPDGYFKGGDIWFATAEDFDAPAKGNYAYVTALHEIGHALGLKHAHTFIGGSDPNGSDPYDDDVGIINLPVAANRDSLEFTVMTYRSYIGQDLVVFDAYTNQDHSFPQTLMMYDIAALQQMYGADFNTNATASVYTFSASTGEMSINGVSEGTLAGNRIFRTIWDGGGVDTYDFSNFGSNQTIDLTPGSWSLMAAAQRADLGSGNFARGNVFNALQFGGDTRSLIENAVGGSGNDFITGNAAANILTGNGGIDTLVGGAGDDRYVVADAGDIITELAGGGYDTIDTALASYVLPTQVEQLFGLSGSGQTLTGHSGNNLIGGNSGNDTVDGGTGSDTLYGGNGDDLIIFDAADSFANVFGGGGFDILNVAGGSAPTGFNLVAQGFERAYHQQTDTTNQSWSNIRDIYLGGWARLQANIFFDDGTRQDRNFDHASNQIYTEYVDYYLDVTVSGTVTRQFVFEDPGTRQERFFDYKNNQTYTEYVNFYTDLGMNNAVTRQVIFNDNSTRQERIFDHNNSQAAYSEYINFYDAAGAVKRQVGFNNGAQVWEYFY